MSGINKLFIRILLCSAFAAGSIALLQSCATERPSSSKHRVSKKHRVRSNVDYSARATDSRSNSRADSSGSGGSSSSSSGGGDSSSSSSGGDSSSSSGGWSDRRLKTDIHLLGTSPSGIPIYSFRYIWGGPLFVGAMAQDLLEIRPDAVIETPSGYYRVDYAKLDIAMVAVEETGSADIAEAVSKAVARAMQVPVKQASIYQERHYQPAL